MSSIFKIILIGLILQTVRSKFTGFRNDRYNNQIPSIGIQKSLKKIIKRLDKLFAFFLKLFFMIKIRDQKCRI